MVTCTWTATLPTRCSDDLAIAGDGPHVCFAHVEAFLAARRARHEVTVERFDGDALVEVEA